MVSSDMMLRPSPVGGFLGFCVSALVCWIQSNPLLLGVLGCSCSSGSILALFTSAAPAGLTVSPNFVSVTARGLSDWSSGRSSGAVSLRVGSSIPVRVGINLVESSAFNLRAVGSTAFKRSDKGIVVFHRSVNGTPEFIDVLGRFGQSLGEFAAEAEKGLCLIREYVLLPRECDRLEHRPPCDRRGGCNPPGECKIHDG